MLSHATELAKIRDNIKVIATLAHCCEHVDNAHTQEFALVEKQFQNVSKTLCSVLGFSAVVRLSFVSSARSGSLGRGQVVDSQLTHYTARRLPPSIERIENQGSRVELSQRNDVNGEQWRLS